VPTHPLNTSGKEKDLRPTTSVVEFSALPTMRRKPPLIQPVSKKQQRQHEITPGASPNMGLKVAAAAELLKL
jgi:hypothetical protein